MPSTYHFRPISCEIWFHNFWLAQKWIKRINNSFIVTVFFFIFLHSFIIDFFIPYFNNFDIRCLKKDFLPNEECERFDFMSLIQRKGITD